MKKISVLITLLLTFMLLSGCSAPAPPNSNPPAGSGGQLEPTINDYFPNNENTKYTYEGKGNEYASYVVYTDYSEAERVQRRSNNGGTETVRVYEKKNGELRLLLSKGETYYRENLIPAAVSGQGELLLKEPLKKGTSWKLQDQRRRSITNEGVEITTPTGSYKALEVTTENPQSKTVDYYAPGVGLVKTVFYSEGTEVTSTLAKIEKDIALEQTVQFFYPDVKNDKIVSVKKKIAFRTNDITRSLLEKAYKEVPQIGVDRVLSPNAQIKSLYLNKDGMVYVDFNKQFVSEMNAGSGYEQMILQSIANTLGTYYGVNKVYLTVEGEPYSSGHILLKKGEALTVDLKGTIER